MSDRDIIPYLKTLWIGLVNIMIQENDYSQFAYNAYLFFRKNRVKLYFSVIIELASLSDEIWTGKVVPLGRLPDFAGILLDFGTNSGAEFG